MEKIKEKFILRRIFNRMVHSIARRAPGALSLRPFLHRLRGVKIGRGVWIADDVYLENEYPELVELEDGAVLGIGSMLVAHTRGNGRIIIGKNACIGPRAVVICEAGRTLRVGEGAVVGTGSIVASNVPPRTLIAPPRSVPVASVSVPFGLAETMADFVAGLKPLRKHPARKPPGSAP